MRKIIFLLFLTGWFHLSSQNLIDSTAASFHTSNLNIHVLFGSDTCGKCVGTASVTVTGGISPYEISWSNGDNGNTAYHLCGGHTYGVTVTDANGCSASESFTMPSDGLPPQPFEILTDDSCLLYGDSSIFYVSPVDSSVTYFWHPFGDSTSYTGSEVTIGFNNYEYYCLRVTAANECGKLEERHIFFVNPPGFCCDSVIPDSITVFPDGYVLQSGDITYGKKYIVKGDLIIPPGTNIIFNHDTLLFYPKGRLILQRGTLMQEGAVAFAEKTIFTAFCPKSMWQGIEVRGKSWLPPGQQAEFTMHGSRVLNAHIGVLVGKRDLHRICSYNPMWPYLWEAFSGGGKFNSYYSIYRNDGIDIYYRSYGNSNSRIVRSNFTSTTLVDDNYYIGNPYHYPNVHNPWLPFGTATGSRRTYAGVYTKAIKKVYVDSMNVFSNMEYGIHTVNSDVLVRKDTIHKVSCGVYHIGSYMSTGHQILSNFMYDIFDPDYNGNNSALPGAAIYVENSVDDLISGNVIKVVNYENNNGIYLKNSQNFKIVQRNIIKDCIKGVVVDNCKKGYIGPWSGNLINWQGLPNIFTDNETGIDLYGDNSQVSIRCNQFTMSPYFSNFISNIYNHGILANQGMDNGNCFSSDRCPAGNLFPTQPQYREINNDNLAYNYYYHEYYQGSTTNNLTEPFSPDNIYIAPVSNSNYITPAHNCPWPIIIINIGLLASNGNISVQQYVDSLSEANESIMALKDSMVLDGGRTQQLLSELEGSYTYSVGMLLYDLYKYSPLSDTVLIAFMNNYVSNMPGIFSLIMRKNLPVSKHVEPYLFQKLSIMPLPIRRYIIRLQGYNPYAITPTYYQREIDFNNLSKDVSVMAAVTYYQDSLSYHPDSITTLYELLGDPSYGMALYFDYVHKGQYNKADSVTNLLYSLGLTDDDWVRFSNDYILFVRDSIIPDSSEYAYIDYVAHVCDSSLSGSMARMLLDAIYNKTVICDCNGGVEDKVFMGYDDVEVPSHVFITRVYPNPFSGSVTFSYEMPDGMNAVLKVYSVDGKIKVVKDIPSGIGKIMVDTKSWSSGSYVYGVYIDGEEVESQKLIKP